MFTRLVFLIVLLAGGLSAHCQLSSEVDFERIHQKKIRKLLVRNNLFQKKDFKKQEEVCSVSGDETFSRHFISFVVKDSPENTWKAYKSPCPRKTWCGKMTSFGVLYSSDDKDFTYSDGEIDSLGSGQIFYIQLHLLGGLFKLAVANKITDVDNENRVMKLCYLSNGASEGSQYIRLTETVEGYTLIEHESFFKSKSKFRDKKLYPKIHEKIIREYHGNVLAGFDSNLKSLK